MELNQEGLLPSGNAQAEHQRRPLLWLTGGVVTLLGLLLVLRLFMAGQGLVGVGVSLLLTLLAYVSLSSRAYAYRYLMPGILAALLFVVFPIVYTFAIGFTNYGGKHLLSFERATSYLMDESFQAEGPSYDFSLHQTAAGYRLRLAQQGGDKVFVSNELALLKPAALKLNLAPAMAEEVASLGQPVELKTLIQLQPALKQLSVSVPQAASLRMTGLRQFAPVQPLYQRQADGTLLNRQDGTVLKPDFVQGYYVNAASGEAVTPGFKVNVGLDNFHKVFSEEKFREPFLRIFVWTVVFAGLSVVLCFGIGVVLAVLLNWEALRFRGVYRTLLFLPYAVPGFISILVFRGLFNESFGEINLILEGLFGIRPAWTSDPFLAKTMILIVNTWLGFPYMMLMCMGLIKSIPGDLYEASAIAGAGPLTNFFRITLPLIMRPMLPLLVSCFAFNFNNFVLISFLTRGGPDFLDTQVLAGATDVVVSYTYRIAFEDSSQHFGMAAAISTVIFFLVALLSIVQLRLMKVGEEKSH